MALKYTLAKVHKNMMVTTNGDVWAYYSLNPEHVPVKNYELKEKVKRVLTHMVRGLHGFVEFDLKMLPKDMDLPSRFKELGKDFAENRQLIGNYYAQETMNCLKQDLGRVTTDDWLIGVQLKSSTYSDTLKDTFKKGIEEVNKQVAKGFGYEIQVTDEYFNQFSYAEKEAFQIVSSMKAVRISEEKNIYLNRYAFIRGTEHAMDEVVLNTDTYGITDGIIDPSSQNGSLILTTEYGQRVVSFLPIAEFEENMSYQHVCEVLRLLPFEVEFHLRGSFQALKGFEGIERKTSRTKDRLKINENEAKQTGNNASSKVSKGKQSINDLEKQLEKSEPVIRWVSCIVVSGLTADGVRERCNYIISLFKGRRITVTRGVSDQVSLFYQTLMGAPMTKRANWNQYTLASGIGELLFGVSNGLGNNVGWYIGRNVGGNNSVKLEDSVNSSRNIVLFHPQIAQKGIEGALTDSPHLAITGETGKGKSFLASLIDVYISFMAGKKLIIDPKKEKRRWFKKFTSHADMRKRFPVLVKHVESFHYVTLDAMDTNNRGVLDPIVFLSGSDAKDTASAMMEEIYNTNGKDDVKLAILTQIKSVIKRRSEGEKVGLMTVVRELANDSEGSVKAAGKLLYEMISDSILELAFSDGQNGGLSLDAQTTILEIEGLDLPKQGDNFQTYTDINRKSICLMLPLGKFTERFGMLDDSENTSVTFEEAWTFTQSQSGARILKSMKRVGRSYNNQLILPTQSVKDLQADDDSGNFGTIFAFDQRSEQGEILDFVGIEDSKENREWLGNMTKGQCLYRDIYGHVDKIAVHTYFEEFIELFKTNESNASSEAEVKFAQ